ncbi:hypothetical protein [Treponema sp. R6D11]
MALIKIPLSEAIEKNIPMGFEITDDILEQSWGQLEDFLREHGWEGHSEEVSKKETGSSGNRSEE